MAALTRDPASRAVMSPQSPLRTLWANPSSSASSYLRASDITPRRRDTVQAPPRLACAAPRRSSPGNSAAPGKDLVGQAYELVHVGQHVFYRLQPERLPLQVGAQVLLGQIFHRHAPGVQQHAVHHVGQFAPQLLLAGVNACAEQVDEGVWEVVEGRVRDVEMQLAGPKQRMVALQRVEKRLLLRRLHTGVEFVDAERPFPARFLETRLEEEPCVNVHEKRRRPA